jgi:hypothetical protein
LKEGKEKKKGPKIMVDMNQLKMGMNSAAPEE